MNKIYKWLSYILVALLFLLSLLKGMDICISHHWGFLQLGLISAGIFACWYGFYRLCLFLGKYITYSYAKVYKEKIIPRIEMEAIDKYIAEHPLPEIEAEDVTEQTMDETNRLKNAQMYLEQFMTTCKLEREAMMVQKEKADAEKLEKILQYTRQTLMKFDFTDEELFQVAECVKTFVTLRAVLPAVNVHIVKKKSLCQGDLKNFSKNIANQYNINTTLTAQFSMYTFRAWFANTEISSIIKNPNATGDNIKIKADPNILEHLEEINQGVDESKKTL